MRHQVAEGTGAGRVHVEAPGVERGVVTPVLQVATAEVADLTELPRLDDLPREPDRRHEPVVEGAHVTDAGRGHRLPDLVALVRVTSERLLADDVLARLRRRDRRLGVQRVRPTVVEQSDPLVRDEIAPVGGRVLPAVATRRLADCLLVAARDPDQLGLERRRPGDVGDLPERVRMGLAHEGVAEHPHADRRHLRDSTRVGSAVKWGIVSTADINRKVIPGAHASDKIDLVGVASRDQGEGRCLRARVGDSARLRLVRGPTGRPRDRGGLHLAAEHAARRVVDQGARGGQARALREAVHAPPGGGGRGVRRRRAERPTAERGVHVPPQPADREARGARSRRRDRRASADPVGLLVRPVRPENIRLRTDVEGGALMDVGCYNVSGSRLLGGEPERVWGEAWYGPSGTDWVFNGTLRFPGDVLATFDCATALAERDELEAIGSEGSLFLDDPWHCVHPVIELRRDGQRRADRARARGLVPAGAREPERRDPRRGRPASRTGRRSRAGEGARSASPLGDDRGAGFALAAAVFILSLGH